MERHLYVNSSVVSRFCIFQRKNYALLTWYCYTNSTISASSIFPVDSLIILVQKKDSETRATHVLTLLLLIWIMTLTHILHHKNLHMYSKFIQVMAQLKMNQVHIYITTECSHWKSIIYSSIHPLPKTDQRCVKSFHGVRSFCIGQNILKTGVKGKFQDS